MWTPRFIKEYTGEGKNLTLEAGRAKITGFLSKRLGLKRKGLIKNSYKADIVIFSFDDFNDKSNFLEPGIYPDGLKYVLVTGCKRSSGSRGWLQILHICPSSMQCYQISYDL